MARSSGKFVAAWILGVAAALTFGAIGGESENSAASAGLGSGLRPIVLPGTGLVIKPGISPVATDSDRSQKALLTAIAGWLSSEFGLPSVQGLPAVTSASKRRMVGLRHHSVPSDRLGDSPGSQPSVHAAEDIVAIYDDEAKVIYLPDGWSGNTPGELSVLVHEMVHHIQNVAGLKFACPEERERTAYEAQERWLGLFGSDLVTEFELDRLTLLVRTNCPY